MSKSPGSMSPLSTTPSLDLLVGDPGPPPKTLMDFDDTYVEDIIPDSPAMPEKNVYDRKGKGKARHRSLSRTPRSAPLIEDPDVLDVMAKQAYLSPPLTASDSFLLGVHNISLALRKGLSSIDFEVDLDLQSGSERSSSPGGRRSPSSTTSDEDEGEPETGAVVVEPAVSELSMEDANESSLLTSSAPSEAESSRKATAGDTTIQDAGSVLHSVRFPSIFIQDMDYSSLDSSRTVSPLLAVSAPIDPEDPERTRKQNEGAVAKESNVGILIHRRENTVEVGVKGRRRRRIWRQRRLKIQEKGLSRDFLLVITLCFCMACAGILIVRPTLMALYGYDTLGDFD